MPFMTQCRKSPKIAAQENGARCCVLWWALDEIRVQVTGRSARYSQVVLELAWNPGPGADASLAAQILAGMTKRAWLSAPIGSVVLVAPGAGAHPGVEPAVDTVQELWPAAVVTVVDETVAALAGAGLDPEPAACVVVHQDGLRTSVAVVAGREAIAGGLVAGGTRGLAQAVVEHLWAEHRLDAGLESAWAAVVHGGAFAPSPTVSTPGPVYGSVITEDRVFPSPPGRSPCRRPNCAPSWPLPTSRWWASWSRCCVKRRRGPSGRRPSAGCC